MVDPDEEMDRAYRFARRKRSERALVHTQTGLSIGGLIQGGFLGPGPGIRVEFNDGLEFMSVETRLTARPPEVRIQLRDNPKIVSIKLAKISFNGGQSWFLRDPVTGKLTKFLILTEDGFAHRHVAGVVYPSQYQSKTHRQILKLDRLVLQIVGMPGVRGPARGKSKLKKLAELKRILAEVKEADRARHKILVDLPYLKTVIADAQKVLRRETRDLSRGWDVI